MDRAAVGPLPSKDGEALQVIVPIDPGSDGWEAMGTAVDTLRADGFDRATLWVAGADDDRRRLLTSSGWAADGSHREIGPDPDLAIKQVRLHTDISPED